MRKIHPYKIAIFTLLALAVGGAAVFAVNNKLSIFEKQTLKLRETIVNQKRTPKPVIIRDFPDKGVVVRHLGDLAQTAEAEYFIQSPAELREAANLYSMMIENTADKPIIALSIAYGFPKPGEKAPRFGMLRSSSVQATIVNGRPSVILAPGQKVAYCLALNGQENTNFKEPFRYVQAEQPLRPQMDQEQLQKRNEAVITQIAAFDNLLASAESFIIEVEGVIFADGSFVGTNRRNLFGISNAVFEGAREFAETMLNKSKQGATHAALIAATQSFKGQKLEDLLRPFGGDMMRAEEAPAFHKQMIKGVIAIRFANLNETDGMNYLRHGVENWKALTQASGKADDKEGGR
ncbi:MAG: hypothetical protein AB7P14_29720 [Blastocatellales bacterium]